MTDKDIEHNYTYHAPTEDKIDKHTGVRQAYKALAKFVNNLEDSREKSLALTALEESCAWAQASIARNPRPE